MSAPSALNDTYTGKFTGRLSVQPEFRGETTWLVEKSQVLAVLESLKKDGFDFLTDLSSVDNSDQEPRFEVVYELLNLSTLQHLRIKTRVADGEAVPSVVHLWKTANWHEREAYDMMGITFEGHPDLRRILMWEGYPYYPLRKEFPLEGKKTEMPDIAFTKPAPLEGGPFVTSPTGNLLRREPRARPPEQEDPKRQPQN
ncbi:MAG: NADH-quinone oxidoreductase subunit C [Methylacidiphilales bacterium]|nr:NADH-quinone oxidoreductase subunit C [Candidatus Methylacidiphilales bacterium]